MGFWELQAWVLLWSCRYPIKGLGYRTASKGSTPCLYLYLSVKRWRMGNSQWRLKAAGVDSSSLKSEGYHYVWSQGVVIPLGVSEEKLSLYYISWISYLFDLIPEWRLWNWDTRLYPQAMGSWELSIQTGGWFYWHGSSAVRACKYTCGQTAPISPCPKRSELKLSRKSWLTVTVSPSVRLDQNQPIGSAILHCLGECLTSCTWIVKARKRGCFHKSTTESGFVEVIHDKLSLSYILTVLGLWTVFT